MFKFQIFGDMFLCGARFEATLVMKGCVFHNVGMFQTTGMGGGVEVKWGWSRGGVGVEKCAGGLGCGEMRKIAQDCNKHSV